MASQFAMVYAYWAILLLGTLAAIAVAMKAGAPPLIDGPDRLPPDEPATPYLLALGIGLLTWAMIPQLYLKILRGDVPAGPASQAARPQLTHLETVTLGNAATFGPFVLIVAVYATMHPAGLRRLGLAPRELPRAILPALAGAVFAIPVVTWVGHISAWLYRALGIQHPVRHDLLEILNTSPDATVRILMLTGAAVGAPLFEELLFRGHVQTLLGDALSGRLQQRTDARPPAPGTAPAPSTALRWTAVMISSSLFAAIHPWWSVPAIFVLSLCLGYAYERTGNLYVPILVHFLFNSSNILLSIYGPQP